MGDRKELTLPWSEELSGINYRTPTSLERPILNPAAAEHLKAERFGFRQNICGTDFNLTTQVNDVFSEELMYRNKDESSEFPRTTVLNIIHQILVLESEMEHNPTFALREEGKNADGTVHSTIPGHTGPPFSQRQRWSEESDEE